MTEQNETIIILVVYRVITIIVGFAIIYLGYLLFKMGLFEKAGELETAWGDKRLVLKRAAPGTFFALFGSIVIAISLLKGFTISESESDRFRDFRGVYGVEAIKNIPPNYNNIDSEYKAVIEALIHEEHVEWHSIEPETSTEVEEKREGNNK